MLISYRQHPRHRLLIPFQVRVTLAYLCHTLKLVNCVDGQAVAKMKKKVSIFRVFLKTAIAECVT